MDFTTILVIAAIAGGIFAFVYLKKNPGKADQLRQAGRDFDDNVHARVDDYRNRNSPAADPPGRSTVATGAPPLVGVGPATTLPPSTNWRRPSDLGAGPMPGQPYSDWYDNLIPTQRAYATPPSDILRRMERDARQGTTAPQRTLQSGERMEIGVGANAGDGLYYFVAPDSGAVELSISGKPPTAEVVHAVLSERLTSTRIAIMSGNNGNIAERFPGMNFPQAKLVPGGLYALEIRHQMRPDATASGQSWVQLNNLLSEG